MRVLLTGATGFLGAHTAEALYAAGHELRLLVRSPDKAERLLGARGLRFETAVGDMADAGAVARALEGCDAAVHAAATLYGGADVLAANVAGARHVLGGAHERGLDPIVHVSTIVAMFPPRGPVCTVDVRDVARVVAACLEPGRGPRRYMAGGHFLGWAEQADLCEVLTGHRIRRVPAPAPLLRLVGRLVDGLKRLVGLEYPLTYEAALLMTDLKPCDSRATLEELGLEFRPARETLAASIRWLHRTGQLDARIAGRLAENGD